MTRGRQNEDLVKSAGTDTIYQEVTGEDSPKTRDSPRRTKPQKGDGGPKAGEKKREAPNDGEGDQEGSWALSLAAVSLRENQGPAGVLPRKENLPI